MGRGRGPRAGSDGIAVPERRRQADGSLDGPRRRPGRSPAPAPAEHAALGQVDRHRPGRRWCRVGTRRALAVGHYKPINSPRSSTTATSSSSTSRRPAGRHSTGSRSVCPTRTNRTSRAGAAPTADCAAGGTRGFSPTRPFRTARRTGRTRPPFRPGCPRIRLKLHGLSRIGEAVDPFLGLGSTAVACARLGVSFAGIEMDEGYLAGGDRPDASGARGADRAQRCSRWLH